MNKPVNMMKNTNEGFSLVELLVTISIMVILVSVLIPNIRTITKERNAREAARTVASIFTQASQRASIDGVAGVVLFRNPNFVIDANDDGIADPAVDFQFAVTSMALLRRVPDYAGDFATATAVISTTFPPTSTPIPPVDQQVVISIPLPVEQADLNLVSPGDRISLNNSRFDYPITNVAAHPTIPSLLDVTIRVGPPVPSALSLPDPTAMLTVGAGVPFNVMRSPRVLNSSTLELASGFVIDLRYSGFNSRDSVAFGGSFLGGDAPGWNSTVFERVPQAPDVTNMFNVPFVNESLAILFDEDGQLDQMGQVTTGIDGIQYAYTSRAQGPLFLFVAEYEAESISSGNEAVPLLEDTNLWVSVSNTTGAVNVSHNIPIRVDLGVDLNDQYEGELGSDPRISRAFFNSTISGARGVADILGTTQTAAQ